MATCRICYGEGEDANPLISPCDCKGSVEFQHTQCLHRWLRVATEPRCELCHKDYLMETVPFEPIYKPPRWIEHAASNPHLTGADDGGEHGH